MFGFVELPHAHDARDQAPTHAGDLQCFHALERDAFLIEEGLLQHHEVFAHHEPLASPDHRCVCVRDRVDGVDAQSVLLAHVDRLVVVVPEERIGAGEIIVGEVGAGPALRHHAVGQTDDPVQARRECPHLLAVLERRVAGVARRSCESDQRVFAPAGPRDDRGSPAPVRAVNLHLHLRVGGAAAGLVDSRSDEVVRRSGGAQRLVLWC